MPQHPISRLMVHPWIGHLIRSMLALAFALALAATPTPQQGQNGNQSPANPPAQGGDQGKHQNVNWNS